MRGKVMIEGDTTGNGNGSGSDGTTVVKAGKAGRGKTQRKRSGEGKPAVVITELPYQTNKVRKLKHMHPSQPLLTALLAYIVPTLSQALHLVATMLCKGCWPQFCLSSALTRIIVHAAM